MDWLQYLIIALIAVFLIQRLMPIKGLNNIDGNKLKEMLKDKTQRVKIIDVREFHEYQSGHIRDALNIPLGKLQYVAKQDLKLEDHIVLVCLSGNRSKMAAKKLKKQGFQNLYNLTGGMSRWRD